VRVTDADGRPVAKAGLGPWLERSAPARARGAVAIALVTDAQMRQLNRTFRGIDAATDVLSFPAGDRREATGRGRSPRHGLWPVARSLFAVKHLGDLAIAVGVARRQARAEGHSLQAELKILALHGLLHLLGYDHERDRGAMRRVEDRLRRRAGLPAGLIARAPVRTTSR
jgi:probable rRNA maturation factor